MSIGHALRWSNPFRKRSSAVLGYVEHADSRVVRGWAWETSRPDSRLCLDVFIDGIFAGCARTGQFRADLLAHDAGDGGHAFVFHVPEFLRDLTVSSENVEMRTTGPSPIRLGIVDKEGRPGKAPLNVVALPPPAFFGPLIDRLAGSATIKMDVDADDRRHVDQLLIQAPEERRTAFTKHIALKYGRSPSDEDVPRWFVETYGTEQGPLRVPLSASDIEDIRNRPVRSRRLIDRYHWAIDEARRLYVEDCSIDSVDGDVLRRVSFGSKLSAFSLSNFMRVFCSRNALLAQCGTRTAEQRRRVYALIMIYALLDAHYLAYVPRHWLTKMLEATTGESLFERVQREFLAAATPIAPDIFAARVAAKGFNLANQSFDGTSYGKARVRHGRRILRDNHRVDVQLIGPFKRSLGLSESCRRIATALQTTGHVVNFVDFDLGNASATAPTDLPIDSIKAARVNILHLNAEEVPEAIAYLPDCFARSHNILVPYWELNRPARVHGLGLALVDEIWATTRYLEDVFRGGSTPVTYVGMGLDDRAPISRDEGRTLLEELEISTDGFIFLTTSDALSWAQRKNVLGTIEAFQAAFPSEEASLVVKTRNLSGPLSPSQRGVWEAIRSRCSDDRRITLLDADLTDRGQRSLMAGSDCLLSLHRAEGLGLDILDALARGTPVVCTGYSGNMDFCDDETAWLVDFDLVPVGIDDYAFVEPGHVWAEPRLASAASALRSVVGDTEGRAERARTARERLHRLKAPTVFSARLSHELEQRLSKAQ